MFVHVVLRFALCPSCAIRIECDAYRYDYQLILTANHTGGVSLTAREAQIEQQYYAIQQQYERHRDDVKVKLKFLDENRVRVVRLADRLFDGTSSCLRSP
jgi:hypothetical protein